MNRRTFITAATILPFATGLQTATPLPRTPDGDTWDNWAAGLAEWDVDGIEFAFRREYRLEWQVGVERGWLLELGNYEQVHGSTSWWHVINWNDSISLFGIVHPSQWAAEDLKNAVSWFRHVGVPVLGTGASPCGRVACCFLNEPKEEVLGVARAWQLPKWDHVAGVLVL